LRRELRPNHYFIVVRKIFQKGVETRTLLITLKISWLSDIVRCEKDYAYVFELDESPYEIQDEGIDIR
jgi:hypothetical protein